MTSQEAQVLTTVAGFFGGFLGLLFVGMVLWAQELAAVQRKVIAIFFALYFVIVFAGGSGLLGYALFALQAQTRIHVGSVVSYTLVWLGLVVGIVIIVFARAVMKAGTGR